MNRMKRLLCFSCLVYVILSFQQQVKCSVSDYIKKSPSFTTDTNKFSIEKYKKINLLANESKSELDDESPNRYSTVQTDNGQYAIPQLQEVKSSQHQPQLQPSISSVPLIPLTLQEQPPREEVQYVYQLQPVALTDQTVQFVPEVNLPQTYQSQLVYAASREHQIPVNINPAPANIRPVRAQVENLLNPKQPPFMLFTADIDPNYVELDSNPNKPFEMFETRDPIDHVANSARPVMFKTEYTQPIDVDENYKEFESENSNVEPQKIELSSVDQFTYTQFTPQHQIMPLKNIVLQIGNDYNKLKQQSQAIIVNRPQQQQQYQVVDSNVAHHSSNSDNHQNYELIDPSQFHVPTTEDPKSEPSPHEEPSVKSLIGPHIAPSYKSKEEVNVVPFKIMNDYRKEYENYHKMKQERNAKINGAKVCTTVCFQNPAYYQYYRNEAPTGWLMPILNRLLSFGNINLMRSSHHSPPTIPIHNDPIAYPVFIPIRDSKPPKIHLR